MVKKLIHTFHSKSLVHNSVYLMINAGISAGVGFLFWLLAARLYTAHDIGIATTLYYSVLMISGFTSIGMGAALLRFVPSAERVDAKLNSSVILVSVLGIIGSIGYLYLFAYDSVELSLIQSNSIHIVAFILFVLFASIHDLVDNTIIAIKKVLYVLQQNIIASSVRFVCLIAFISIGAFGIFSSIYLALVTSLLVGILVLHRQVHYKMRLYFSWKEIGKMLSYSSGTFIAGQAANIPNYILPIIITNTISPASTAYYFIASSIANLLFLIPKIVSQNLLVEGSQDEKMLRSHVLHATLIIFSMYTSAAIIIIFFGFLFLQAFGKAYSQEGSVLLQILALSGFFVCMNYILGTIISIKKKVSLLVLANIFSGVILVVLSFYFKHFGIVGVGYATFITQILLSVLYGVCFISRKALRV